MKKHIIRYSIPVLVLFLVNACTKRDGITNQPYEAYGNQANKSQLKINIAYAYNTNNTNALIKINNTVVSNLLAGRTPFPGGGYNTNGSNFALYLSVPLGGNLFSIVIPKVGTTSDSVVLYSTTVTTPDMGPYTLHVTDTMVNTTTNNTKSVLVKNIISDLDTGRVRYKFVNLMPNVPSLDLYLNGVLIKGGVTYLTASDTFSVRTGVNAPGYVSGTAPIWAIRPTGAAATSTALASYNTSTAPLTSQYVVTVFGMGYSGATGARLPFVAFTLDKNQ